MGGGSNLILGTGIENQIFFLRTQAAIKVFTKFSKIVALVNIKIITLPDGFVPYMILLGNHNFARSTNKIQFLTKFSHLKKNCRLNEIPKI